MSNHSTPFKDFLLTSDMTKCKNKKCKDRLSCYRYMGKPDKYWQFYFTKNDKYNKEECEHYHPYYIWRDFTGKPYLLSDITDRHLLAIIIHLYERYINGETTIIGYIKEFSKEARKRKLIK